MISRKSPVSVCSKGVSVCGEEWSVRDFCTLTVCFPRSPRGFPLQAILPVTFTATFLVPAQWHFVIFGHFNRSFYLLTYWQNISCWLSLKTAHLPHHSHKPKCLRPPSNQFTTKQSHGIWCDVSLRHIKHSAANSMPSSPDPSRLISRDVCCIRCWVWSENWSVVSKNRFYQRTLQPHQFASELIGIWQGTENLNLLFMHTLCISVLSALLFGSQLCGQCPELYGICKFMFENNK